MQWTFPGRVLGDKVKAGDAAPIGGGHDVDFNDRTTGPLTSARRPTPPRPPITFRVGVVGHRPDRLPQGDAGLEPLRVRLAEVLAAVAAAVAEFAAQSDAGFYNADSGLILRANSPLAEGADRMFAQEALRLGYHLNCITPFAQEEFERDFQTHDSLDTRSLEEFRGILRQAKASDALTLFELDGRRTHNQESYLAAGRVVLNQSDLLVVVWDGGGPNGVGGTVDTLREAIDYNVPALWIDSRAPHAWRLLRQAEDLDCLDDDGLCTGGPAALGGQSAASLHAAVGEVVSRELDLPLALGSLAPDAETRAHLSTYLGERKPDVNFSVTWKLFRDLMDRGVLRWPRFTTQDFVSQICADWPTAADATDSPPSASASWINTQLRPYYAWSDKLADLYADGHRSGFVWSALLAATAVFTALLPVAGHFSPRAAVATGIVEAAILCVMVALPIAARRRRWHQRWMEYRNLAELIRELRILVPLGGARPLPRTAPHLASYGDPTRSWMYWQVRAIARATGLPNVQVTGAYAAEQLTALLALVGNSDDAAARPGGQLGFHQANAERMERIHRRLHRISLILFSITLIAVGVDWAARVAAPAIADEVIDWLILVAAGFPALGAALASINNQGEFARLQRRSQAMTAGLADLRGKIAHVAARPGPLLLSDVTELAAELSTMMLDENTEWRIVVQDLPHAAG